jgi:hypothetical protein
VSAGVSGEFRRDVCGMCVVVAANRRDSCGIRRREKKMGVESLYSCSFSGVSRFGSAWLSEADSGRLLPVCCPGWPTAGGTLMMVCVLCSNRPSGRTAAAHAGRRQGLHLRDGWKHSAGRGGSRARWGRTSRGGLRAKGRVDRRRVPREKHEPCETREAAESAPLRLAKSERR